MAAVVDEAKCDGCGDCEGACPVNAITMENEKAVVDGNRCDDCGDCVEECPVGAISVP